MTPVEINGKRFRLSLNADDKPYVLKQQKRSAGGFGNRLYWGIVWAEWHKGLPTGDRMTAIEASGFKWDRTPPHCQWVAAKVTGES